MDIMSHTTTPMGRAILKTLSKGELLFTSLRIKVLTDPTVIVNYKVTALNPTLSGLRAASIISQVRVYRTAWPLGYRFFISSDILVRAEVLKKLLISDRPLSHEECLYRLQKERFLPSFLRQTLLYLQALDEVGYRDDTNEYYAL